MSESPIEVSELTRVFPVPGRLFRRRARITALDAVTFRAGAGEVVAIVGPNGAGKTTLLKILATAVAPTSGAASVCGYDVTAQPADVKRRIGFAAGDERSLYWRLTGRQNLALFGTFHGLAGAPLRKRTEDLLRQVGLAKDADRPVRTWSSGMRQRLALARALLHDPRVLLLDEPGRGLDPRASDAFLRFLRGFAEREGRIVLLATHRLADAAAVAGRVLVMQSGKILHDGPPGLPENLQSLLNNADDEDPGVFPCS